MGIEDKMIRELVRPRGLVEIRVKELWKPEYVLLRGENMVTSFGEGLLASLLAGDPGTPPDHMAIGTSGTSPLKSQTALQGTEKERVAASATVINNNYKLTGIFGSGLGANATIQEWGLFDAGAAGNMFARFITGPFDMTPTMVVTVDWEITFGG